MMPVPLNYTIQGGSEWKKMAVNIGSMIVDAVRFKNADGERFGFMTVENALADKWIIQPEGGGEETYQTVDALLAAGWVLD